MTGEVRKSGVVKKIALTIAGVFIGLTVLGAIVGDDNQPPAQQQPLTTNASPAQANTPPPEPQSNLTGPQRNAARSARSYLDMSGFSRKGLIHQLSADAGEGYEVADATAAVDSLNVDWNEQAVRSAKQYLEMSGFSCKGLIEQLSSSAGEKYSKAEATYGAKQAGAC